MVKLFHLKIKQASEACVNLAAKIETDSHKRGKYPSKQMMILAESYMRLAEDIEAMKYITSESVSRLVQEHGFLREFQL